MEKIVIILLAGGEASRYNFSLKLPTDKPIDKLLSNRDNISLLEFVTDELKPLGDIIIVTRGKKRKQQYFTLLDNHNQDNSVKIVTEDYEKSIGPIGGIYSALKLCNNIQTKVILPADLPNVKQGIIAEFIARASQSVHFDLISLVHPNGQTENLVLVGHGNELLRMVQLLVKAHIYRVSSVIRLISKKRFINTSLLTKDIDVEETFDDLDYYNSILDIKKEDYEKGKNNNAIKSPFIDFGFHESTDEYKMDPSLLYKQFLHWKNNPSRKNLQERTSSMVDSLLKESIIYKNRGLLSLSLHCLLDAYDINNDLTLTKQIDGLIMKLDN